MRGQQAAAGIETEVAQRGEAHVETQLSMEQAVHLLQFGGDLPLRDAVVVEGQAVEHHRVQMHVHQARQQRGLAAVDDFRLGGNLDLALAANFLDATAFNNDHRILDRLAAIAINQQAALDDAGGAFGFDGFEFEHAGQSSGNAVRRRSGVRSAGNQ